MPYCVVLNHHIHIINKFIFDYPLSHFLSSCSYSYTFSFPINFSSILMIFLVHFLLHGGSLCNHGSKPSTRGQLIHSLNIGYAREIMPRPLPESVILAVNSSPVVIQSCDHFPHPYITVEKTLFESVQYQQ